MPMTGFPCRRRPGAPAAWARAADAGRSSVPLARRRSPVRSIRPIVVGLHALVGVLLPGCATRARLDDRIEQLSAAVAEAESTGAMQCAPRELAVALSQLEFGRLEREQGSGARAFAHLELADQNVRAAKLLSEPPRCGDPGEASFTPSPALPAMPARRAHLPAR